jgi:Hint domain
MAAYQFVYTVLNPYPGSGVTPGIWSNTGASTGTPDSVIKPVVAGTAAALGFLPGYGMARLGNGNVVFGATSNGSTSLLDLTQGIQLWVTDGTAAGTTEIFSQGDPLFGAAGDTSAFTGFTAWNNVVLFEYNQGSANNDILYSTDGTVGNQTTTGTIQISSQAVDDASIGVGEGASTGTKFVYSVRANPTLAGLWATNGSLGSASIIKAAVTGTNAVIGFLPTYQMASLPNGKVVFGATSNRSTNPNAIFGGIQLWVTDGTAAGTVQIAPNTFFDAAFGSASDPAGLSNFITVGSKVFFIANDGMGALLLYSTDGTSGGTQSTGVSPDANSLGPGQAAGTGSKLIFATSTGVYSSDGTSGGTSLILSNAAESNIEQGFVAGTQMATLPNGSVVFTATSYLSGPSELNVELWVTNGVTAQKIYSVASPAGSAFVNAVSVGNGVQVELYLGSADANLLYLTDGTAGGTHQIDNYYLDNNSVGAGLGASPICFLPGTRIATPNGEVQIQDLAVGDLVTVVSGEARTVRWIGHGKVLATRGRRSPATPVIVRKGAFADNVPNADLHVTKAHSFLIDGVLIPAEYLVNHRSILWDDWTQEVELYHVELDTHDAIFANGAPAETYRDDGNRWLFQNANDGWHLPPQPPFAPVTTGGLIVDRAWLRLCQRAGPRNLPPMTDDPDLHLIVAGKRVNPTPSQGHTQTFRLPAWPARVQIASRDAVPSELGYARDHRALGVALHRVVLRQGARFGVLDASDDRLTDGFHGFEPSGALRWTDGCATLPHDAFPDFAGPVEILITVAATTRYPDVGVLAA